MFRLRLFLAAVSGPFVLLSAAAGGTVRYDLPVLLGEHVFDGSDSDPFGPVSYVDTPFGFYSVSRARLVVEGFVTPGRAHGDGVLRQDIEFELLPDVGALPSFARNVTFSIESTIGSFQIEEVYPDPFVPEVTPLPNPDGYPPISFYVRFSVGPSWETEIPPLLEPVEPGDFFLWTDGIIVDEPITAHVTQAYILFEGPGVVPEPTSAVMIAIGLLLFGLRHRRARVL
jgi:hypothetical protein